MHWYLAAFKKYADLQGRARRREYWTFQLVNFGAYLLLSLINDYAGYWFAAGILLPNLAVTVRRLHDIGKSGWWLLLVLLPHAFILIATLCIFIGFGIRADVGAVIGTIGAVGAVGSLIAIIGATIIFLIWMLQDSRPGANKYGENPKDIEPLSF